MKPWEDVAGCRICGNAELVPLLSLGEQALTGVFPRSRDERITKGPVDLVKCAEAPGRDSCGLVQLRQSYDKKEMYGDRYGYRSGLNPSMVRHLQERVRKVLSLAPLRRGDVVLDIGSNDGTTLSAYPADAGAELVGIDPTGEHFRRFYPENARLAADFFSADTARKHLGGRKARIVTSIAMFYDLDAPRDFIADAAAVLADDGVWLLEQSYLPAMLATNSYDTICHEHLEYYGVRQMKWMFDRAGLKIVDVELNDVNGGSFALTVAKKGSPLPEKSAEVARLLREEASLAGLEPYRAFASAVARHREELRAFFTRSRAEGRTVLGYGASTKGNVILQYCGVTAKDLPRIGEVNPEKFGAFTPGTLIPIAPEAEVKAERPDHLLVLPWHFKDFIMRKEEAYLRAGGRLLFPLPALHAVPA